jgi:hypothetical protein
MISLMSDVVHPPGAGVQVQFLLPSTDTPWQKAEELGWKDRIAMKVDSRNPYQYAPNGLALTKVRKPPPPTPTPVPSSSPHVA